LLGLVISIFLFSKKRKEALRINKEEEERIAKMSLMDRDT